MPQNLPIYLKWQIPEYRRPERGRKWYIAVGIFIFICLFFSFFAIENWRIKTLGASSNFLFILIILLVITIIIIKEGRKPQMLTVELGPEGVKIENRFYDYDEIKNFVVLYKPKMSIKSLYFEFKNEMRQRLSIPLRSLDPLTVRNFLVRYLDENLERVNPPLSEQLTKILKL